MKHNNTYCTSGFYEWVLSTYLTVKHNNLKKIIDMYVEICTQHALDNITNYIERHQIKMTESLVLFIGQLILSIAQNAPSLTFIHHLIYYVGYHNCLKKKFNEHFKIQMFSNGFKLKFDGNKLQKRFSLKFC